MAGAFASSILTSGASAQLGGGDECASAVVIAADVPTNFDTTNATASGNIPTDALCTGTYLNWVATCKDVWFKFTASGPGTADFSTCGTAAYDTSLALYKGSCATLVACNGDAAGCAGYSSKIAAVPCAAGDVFYLRIGGYGGNPTPDGDFGAGSVTVVFAASSAGCVGASGACNVVHASLGCDNAACCTNICTFNPPCCEVGWDQGCVALAVELCGYYSCPVVPGAPANNCATSPTTIPSASSSRTFTTVGATTDGPVTDGALCNSGSDNFYGDIWYKVSPIANGSMTISTCDTVSFDNKLAVYNLGANPATFDYNLLSTVLVGCNDDGASTTCMTTETPPTNYASEMTAVVSLGNTYLIRMGAYADGDDGTGTIRFTLPTTCVLDTPTGSENEPCGSATDDGCNAAGESQPISIGSIVGGTIWADADSRDTDFYSFSVAAGSQVTLSVKSARLVNVLLLSGDLSVVDCAGITVLASGAGSCPTVTTYCLNPGVYYAFVSDSAYTGNPCGTALNDYTLRVTSAPATCPIPVSGGYNGTTTDQGVCAVPGIDTKYSGSTVAPTLIGQGCATPCGNLSGGNADVMFASRFQTTDTLDEITCIGFGVACVLSANNASGVCGYYFSDKSIPAQLSLYKDIDGGVPTNIPGFADSDLELLVTYDILVKPGVYTAVLNLPQPFCVEAVDNLVVVFSTPNLFQNGAAGIPAGSGYRIGAGLSVVPATDPATAWRRYTLCTGAAQNKFDPAGYGTGAGFAWPVSINGKSSASCSAPPCAGDFDLNGIRNGGDLATLLSAWNTPAADITGDGVTNGADLTVLLSGWGACPN